VQTSTSESKKMIRGILILSILVSSSFGNLVTLCQNCTADGGAFYKTLFPHSPLDHLCLDKGESIPLGFLILEKACFPYECEVMNLKPRHVIPPWNCDCNIISEEPLFRHL